MCGFLTTLNLPTQTWPRGLRSIFPSTRIWFMDYYMTIRACGGWLRWFTCLQVLAFSLWLPPPHHHHLQTQTCSVYKFSVVVSTLTTPRTYLAINPRRSVKWLNFGELFNLWQDNNRAGASANVTFDLVTFAPFGNRQQAWVLCLFAIKLIFFCGAGRGRTWRPLPPEMEMWASLGSSLIECCPKRNHPPNHQVVK